MKKHMELAEYVQVLVLKLYKGKSGHNKHSVTRTQ